MTKTRPALSRTPPVVIMFQNAEREEYYFSTDHCQPHEPGFIPSTTCLPLHVVKRLSLPSGVVTTVEDLLNVFHRGEREIPNPDPRYQPADRSDCRRRT